MQLDAILISDVCIDEFLKVDDALVMCDLNHRDCKICFDYAEKIPVSEFRTSLGGNSANVAAGMAQLGLKVSVYAEIGNDENGQRFVRELKERGVDNSLLVQNNCETDVHSIIIYKGERTILSYHRPKNYKILNWEEPKWIYYSSLAKDFEHFQQELLDYLIIHPKVLTAFNPGVYHLKAGYQTYAPFLAVTDLLFVNREEALKILQQADKIEGIDLCDKTAAGLKKLHAALQTLGPKMTVITDAERGASVSSGADYQESGIVEINAPLVDKTGAGDAFASGYLSALLFGKDTKTALKWGLKNSSACIREIGPMNGLLTKEELEK
ncbi:carbohydrate kinase family protein [Patescibacteria group bacterium]|nr:carbohydrate kinase family protein [Patescibacteria group bacterium]MBU1970625.1 carbohydrate kinase family protein [Patescibacteria group bacterium]